MKAVENEQAKADELIAAFPGLYIHARMERRMPRAKRITTEGMIEICPGEACEGHEDDTYDLITVRGENRFQLAHVVCKAVSKDVQRHNELLHA